jgi:hypothetical protein
MDPTHTEALAATVVRSANYLSSEIAVITYTVGHFVALGMNWADKDTSGLEAPLLSLLSWTNVGFLAATRHS